MTDFEALPPRERNLLRYTFLDESTRELFADWDEVARDNVATLRLDAGRHPDDPQCTYTAEAGSPSESALKLLANWTGDYVRADR